METSPADAATLERAFPVLAVADLEAAIAYYTAALGFAEAWRWGEPAVRAGVARGGVELQLVRAGTPGAPRWPGVVYCHVRGVDAYHAACTRRGATIREPLAARAFGLHDFRVHDLDENLLGFGERSPSHDGAHAKHHSATLE